MFDEKSLNTLEYGKILSLAAAYTQSEGGRRDMLALVPCSALAAASRELSLTAEADRVLFEFSVSPSFAIDDIDEVLQKAEKGAVLSIGELLRAGRVLRVADRLSAGTAERAGRRNRKTRRRAAERKQKDHWIGRRTACCAFCV